VAFVNVSLRLPLGGAARKRKSNPAKTNEVREIITQRKIVIAAIPARNDYWQRAT
jgi:hypothetical protein